MKLLVVYATNSGSTYLVAQRITEQLQAQHHDVTLMNVINLAVDQLNEYDCTFFGSNSWDFERKEGQPHHAFIKFLTDNQHVDWSGKRFILFGCGDKTYMHFCGALTVIEEFVRSHGGAILGEPLKIDRFFFRDQSQTFQEIDAWVVQTTPLLG